MELVHTVLMTRPSLFPKTTSNGPIAIHCTIPIVSTLVTLNLVKTSISHCLYQPQVFNILNDFKLPPHITLQLRIPCTHSLIIQSTLKQSFPLFLPPPTDSLPLAVKLRRNFSPQGLDKLSVKLSALPHSLN